MTERIERYGAQDPGALPECAEAFINYVRYLERIGYRGAPVLKDPREAMKGLHPNCGRETLEAVRQNLGDCRRCKLHRTRKHLVFGSGSPHARLMVVGEAPCDEEDAQALPFVGPAGELLTKMLQAIELTREEVYITNIIKCRPQGDTNPEAQEVASCVPFLHRQIRAIGPALICAMGTFAAQALLRTDSLIPQLRGRFYGYDGIRVLPTYHPAHLLTNPEKKREAWIDMQRLQKAYESS